MDFGEALQALKEGRRVARTGWNGRGMWLALVLGHEWEVKRTIEIDRYDDLVPPLSITSPFVMMLTATNERVPWLASQTDLLADDWTVVE